MRPLTVIAICLAIASAAGVGGFLLGHPDRTQPPDKPSSTEILKVYGSSEGGAKLAEVIKQLDRRLAALELKQLQTKPEEVQAPAKAVERLDPATIKEKHLERAAAIETALRMQTRDVAWAPIAENQLQTAVDGATKDGAQFSVKNLRCMTSICEMVLSASNPDHLRHTMFQLDPHITGMKGFDVAPLEVAADGSATLTYRLFREGYARPDEGT